MVSMGSYSILMSVYAGENPVYFKLCIQSIVNQTVLADEIVIVCDGPLTEELDNVLDCFVCEYPSLFKIIRLQRNVGIGSATSEGLKHCKNELIAKMDSNDIAVPERCELQLKRFAENPNLTVLGGYIEEFDKDTKKGFAIREVPLTNEEIRKYARRRQPFNNVTVMYKKSAVVSVGGYNNLRRGEDYDLYIRLLKAGYYTENLSNILVKVRVEQNIQVKRHSFETFKGFVQTRWNTFRIGYSSIVDFLICFFAELIVFICPNRLQHIIYKKFLRKSINNPEDVNSE